MVDSLEDGKESTEEECQKLWDFLLERGRLYLGKHHKIVHSISNVHETQQLLLNKACGKNEFSNPNI